MEKIKYIHTNSLNFLLTILIFSSLFVSSCSKDWFDEKSDKNLAVPATLQDFEYLLDNYNIMTLVSPALGEMASDGHFIPESMWQTITTNVDNNAQRNAYVWGNAYLYESVKDWNLNYTKIFHCNLVLDRLNKVIPGKESEQEQFDQIKGNALFHRAKCFYDLAQIYGQPYIEKSAAQDLGIPLKEDIDGTQKISRSSIKDVYDRVLTDLKISATLLPNSPQYLTRGSRLAAFGLLARVYLTMGNYEEAGHYADSVLKVNNNLLEFKKIQSNNANMGLFNSEVIFHSLLTNYGFLFVPGFTFVDKEFYDLYEMNDLRKTRFFTSQSNNIAFKGTYNKDVLLFSGLAIDEMYLIRAECAARLGNVSGAMKDLNDLLRTRWDKNPNGTTMYVDQKTADPFIALNIILLERKKELLFRGLRWTDLRRLNLDDRFKISITKTIGGKTYTLEPNSYKYSFPIPDDEIALSGIQQNPFWKR